MHVSVFVSVFIFHNIYFESVKEKYVAGAKQKKKDTRPKESKNTYTK